MKQVAAEGFFGRWSRLKAGADVGEDREKPADAAWSRTVISPASPSDAVAASTAVPAAVPASVSAAVSASVPAPGAAPGHVQASSPLVQAYGADQGKPGRTDGSALPSIDSLGTDSDFSMFMRSDVDPGMRVSALKKLFSDPRFNRMDGLDIYIDDYSKPDPIPLALLRQMNQSRILGLFEEESPEAGAEPVAALAAGAGPSDGAAADNAAVEGAAADDAASDGAPAESAAMNVAAPHGAVPDHVEGGRHIGSDARQQSAAVEDAAASSDPGRGA